MTVLLSPVGGAAAQFFDNNGTPLTGGKLYSYVAGTTTPQATYTSASGATAHTNPIIFDSGGRVPGGEIWLTDGLQYKFVLRTSADVLIGTYDNLVGVNSNFVNFLTDTEVQTATAGQTVFTLTTMQYQPGTNNLTVYVDGVNQIDGVSYSYVETSSTVVTFTAGLHVGALVKFTTAQTLSTGVTDASLVTYDPPFTASVATTVELKLAQTVSVKDFGAVGDGSTDDTTAFTNALASGQSVFIPEGTYLITSSLTVSTNAQMIYGVGYGKSIVQRGNDTSFIIFNVTAAYGVEFHNFKIQEQNVSSTNTGSFITCAVGGGTDVLIQGMWFWYGYLHVRCLQGTSNITFSNTVFEAGRKGAIFSSSSVRNKIVGCTFWKNSADFSNPSDRGYAIFLAKDGGYSFGSDNWNIVGNYFAENVYGPFLLAGQSEGVQITGNFFEIASQVDNGQKSDIELTSCTRWSIVGNTSDSINNSYLPGGRGSKYVVDLSGGGNAEIAIIGNGFEAGVLGTINDPSRITDTAGAYPIAWSMPVQLGGSALFMGAQTGIATRIGKQESLSASSTIAGKGLATGVMRLGPLPHTPAQMGFGSGYILSTSGITTPIYFQFNTDGYVYPLYGVSTNVFDTNIADGSVVVFSGTYPIA